MSRAWTSDGAERGDLKAFGATAGSITVDTTSRMTGANCYRFAELGSNGTWAETPTWTANAEIFVQARVELAGFAGFAGSAITGAFFKIFSGASLVGGLGMTTAGLLFLILGSGTVLATDSTPLPVVSGSRYLVQLRWKMAASGANLEVKVDGVSRLTYSGDTRNGLTTSDRVRFQNPATTGGLSIYMDDNLVNINDASGAEDGFDADIRIVRKAPSGTGNTTQLTGTPLTSGTWQNVDERPPNTTDYNFTSTSGQKDTYALAASGIPVGSVIHGVTVDAEALTLAAPQSAQAVLRSGGTDYTGPSTSLPTSFGRIANRWRLNPATSAVWTISEVDASEAGILLV